MQILRPISDDTVALHFPIRMDESTNQQIREVLDGVQADGQQNVILDFSEVEYLNSSAVGLLLAFVASVRKAGRSCGLGGMSEAAEKILNAMRIIHHLKGPVTGQE